MVRLDNPSVGSSEVSYLQTGAFSQNLKRLVGQSGIFGGSNLSASGSFAAPHRVDSLWFVRVRDQGFEEKTKCSFQFKPRLF